MNIELTKKQFRLLLDLVYVGNWVLNSTRGSDRFEEYDEVESLVFSHCKEVGMSSLSAISEGEIVPSAKYADGGIHEAIMEYEDTVFFEILAEELARRDMNHEPINDENFEELAARMDEYIEEFEINGTDNILLDL
ncbi:MAG: hypothetical protein ACOX7P_09835 [Oscillospiraceae bacterium]|jgi:nitrogenase subunit NifH